jgi:cholesterol oxidase
MATDAGGFTFTETMGGYVASGAETYRAGASRGRRNAESLRFKLTIRIADLRAFLHDPSHTAVMTGVVDSSRLGRGLQVDSGTFNLLQRMDSGRLRMGYHVEFRSRDGDPYVLEGFKDVHNDHVVDLWYDTTALFTILRPADAVEGPDVYRGILRISPIALVPQVLSMRDPNSRSLVRHATALARFNWFFSTTLAKEYARPPRRGQGSGPA